MKTEIGKTYLTRDGSRLITIEAEFPAAAPTCWTSCILDKRVLHRATTKGEAAEGALSALGFWCLADEPYELVHI